MQFHKFIAEAAMQKLAEVESKYIPPAEQKNSYSCGPAAAQSIAHYFGKWTRQDDLADDLHTTSEKGTSPESIAAYFNKKGLKAEVREDLTIDDLREFTNDKNTAVILDFQAWGDKKNYSDEWEDGHYAVLSGINDTDITFRDPSLNDDLGKLSISDFESRWHDKGSDGKKYNCMGIVVKGKKDAEPETVKIGVKDTISTLSSEDSIKRPLQDAEDLIRAQGPNAKELTPFKTTLASVRIKLAQLLETL
jgi:uncharacterized protein